MKNFILNSGGDTPPINEILPKGDLAKFMIDLKYRALVSASDIVMRISTVYFAILTVFIGIYIKDVQGKEMKFFFMATLVIISIGFTIACVALAIGVVVGIKELKADILWVTSYNLSSFNMNKFFVRGYVCGLIALIFLSFVPIAICILVVGYYLA